MDTFASLAVLNREFWRVKRDIDRSDRNVRRLIKKMPSVDAGDQRQQKWIAKMYPELSRLNEFSKQALSVQENIVALLQRSGMPVPQEMRDSITEIQQMLQQYAQVQEQEKAGVING